MSTIATSIERDLRDHENKAATMKRLKAVVAELDLEECEGFSSTYPFDNTIGSLYLKAASEDQARALIAGMLTTVGKFTKGFDSCNNQLEFTAKYNNVRIVLSVNTPATCTVEEIEEETYVEAVPAHTETRKRYVLKGDCSPFME